MSGTTPADELALVPARVDAGILYLDLRYPDWLAAMPEDLSRLDMGEVRDCVGAYAAKDGRNFVEFAHENDWDFGDEKATNLGFDLPKFPIQGTPGRVRFADDYYLALTDEWRKRIAARRYSLFAQDERSAPEVTPRPA